MYKIHGKYKFRDKPNRNLWIYGDNNGVMHYCTDGYRERRAKLKYKHPTGWECIKYGLYFEARFPDGGKKNIYLMDLSEYK